MKVAMLALLALAALTSGSAAQFSERKEGSVVIITPSQPSPTERRLQELDRQHKKTMKQLDQQRRKINADAAERQREYCDWHEQNFRRRGYEPPPGCD